MSKRYTLFVDESGDAGTSKIRSEIGGGASPFMVLGGVLIEEKNRCRIDGLLSKICAALKCKTLHCKELSHSQKLYYARAVSDLAFTSFGLISDKKTLGGYKQIKDKPPYYYYHKCVQLLLEKVCRYIRQHEIDPNLLDIAFEETGALKLNKLQSYIFLCGHKPKWEQSKILTILDTSNFHVRKKNDESLLQLADLIANSLYQCVNKSDSNFQIPETRYIHELRRRFWGNPNDGRVVGYGIKPVHELRNLSLDEDVDTFFRELKNY